MVDAKGNPNGGRTISAGENGLLVIGEKGKLFVSRGAWRLRRRSWPSRSGLAAALPDAADQSDGNFLECVASRMTPITGAEVARFR